MLLHPARVLVTLMPSLAGALGQPLAATAAPGQDPAPHWDKLVRLNDDRRFVSDGRFLLDVTLAKLAKEPTQLLSGTTAKVVERYLIATLPDEFGLSQLARDHGNYKAPSGVILNASYVDYLRQLLGASQLSFRMKTDLEPVVILLDGKAVGLLMPMRR